MWSVNRIARPCRSDRAQASTAQSSSDFGLQAQHTAELPENQVHEQHDRRRVLPPALDVGCPDAP